jgi:hypothetical protein
MTTVSNPTAELTDRERKLVSALRYAWHELNMIRARDGRPYAKWDGMPTCTEAWWDELTKKCGAVVEEITGQPPMPWPFSWEKESDTDVE